MAAGADKVDQMLNQTAAEWSGYMVREFQRDIRKRKIEVTGELEGSFEDYVTEVNGGFVVHLRFKAYGNIITRSKVFWTKPANSDALGKWVRKVGVGYFDYTPGYNKGWTNDDKDHWGISDAKAARRIANAIAFQRVNGSPRREYGKMRPQNWKRKPFGVGKAYLKHLIRERLAEVTKKQIVEALTTQ